ncbi:MAG: hypothetical protein JRE57_00015 [Deltaproteobacteria bacterium]|nr:hypothetical protein [Deltaproteobacteria bacterium]
MAKQAHQQAPSPTDQSDVATREFVERLGGRGAPDFIVASMSGDQTYASGTAIDFDTIDNKHGLSVDGAGKFSTLKVGRTYLLQGSIKGAHGSSAFENRFSWYDVTGAVTLGVQGVIRSTSATTHNSTQSVATYIITPSVDTEVELRMDSGGTASTTMEADSSWAIIMELGGPGGLAGPLEHLETIEVGADTTTVTFDGLNGDEDDEYYLEYFFPDPVGTVSYTLRPNGVTANQTGARIFGGSSLDDATLTSLLIAAPISGDENSGRCWLTAKTGQNRFFHGQDAQISASADYVILTSGRWADTATNITSLDVTASVASAIKQGARFSLYRLKRTNSSNIVSRTVLTADATTLSLTGLDGDTDGEYEISGTLLLSLSAHDLDIEPNGSTTGVRTSRTNDGLLAHDDASGLFMNNGATSGALIVSFTGRIWAARTVGGVARHRTIRIDYVQNYTGNMNLGYIGAALEDDSANLTGLDFTSSVASGILEGSEVTVRRVG